MSPIVAETSYAENASTPANAIEDIAFSTSLCRAQVSLMKPSHVIAAFSIITLEGL